MIAAMTASVTLTADGAKVSRTIPRRQMAKKPVRPAQPSGKKDCTPPTDG
jgi:hypothetical protein